MPRYYVCPVSSPSPPIYVCMRLFNIPGVSGVCLVRMPPCLPFPSSPSPTTVVRSRRKSLVSSAGMDRRGEGSSTIMPPVGMYTSYTFSDLRGLVHLISLRSIIFVVWFTLFPYVQSSSWSGTPYFHTFDDLHRRRTPHPLVLHARWALSIKRRTVSRRREKVDGSPTEHVTTTHKREETPHTHKESRPCICMQADDSGTDASMDGKSAILERILMKGNTLVPMAPCSSIQSVRAGGKDHPQQLETYIMNHVGFYYYHYYHYYYHYHWWCCRCCRCSFLHTHMQISAVHRYRTRAISFGNVSGERAILYLCLGLHDPHRCSAMHRRSSLEEKSPSGRMTMLLPYHRDGGCENHQRKNVGSPLVRDTMTPDTGRAVVCLMYQLPDRG
ncbi:uncharacterized protein K489DRAFT_231235 [Dissoconium aciculare CBS 342.82]|uniref:Uncharacterized protein n=1 Tax=Dissoconium aciculare CBS 342.82 TaxID=1314786 RepID=A0A6J3M221_9PEZI|nr:uncharacterized protein K489DRAFT_231235 [Dissoconium aciculare CBS 342.82]KAF1822056.1 hypothetical protein K489DRAFT_231235 [Dissoconium aciculare CBS 342.82]